MNVLLKGHILGAACNAISLSFVKDLLKEDKSLSNLIAIPAPEYLDIKYAIDGFILSKITRDSKETCIAALVQSKSRSLDNYNKCFNVKYPGKKLTFPQVIYSLPSGIKISFVLVYLPTDALIVPVQISTSAFNKHFKHFIEGVCKLKSEAKYPFTETVRAFFCIGNFRNLNKNMHEGSYKIEDLVQDVKSFLH